LRGDQVGINSALRTYFFGNLGFSIAARSHSTSTIAEKSLAPKPRARAVLKA